MTISAAKGPYTKMLANESPTPEKKLFRDYRNPRPSKSKKLWRQAANKVVDEDANWWRIHGAYAKSDGEYCDRESVSKRLDTACQEIVEASHRPPVIKLVFDEL